MLRRLAGLTSGTTADGAQTATPRIFGRRRAAEAKPPPESAPEGKGGAAGPAEAKGAPRTAADAKAAAAPLRFLTAGDGGWLRLWDGVTRRCLSPAASSSTSRGRPRRASTTCA